MKRYKYNINNLDCADCAREIEEELNKNKNMNKVIVNFSTSKLSYNSNKDFSLEELNTLIKKVEPEAYISNNSINQKNEYNPYIFIIGFLTALIGYLTQLPLNINYILIIIGYILLLYRPLTNALKMLVKSKNINENFLISISCIGALLVGETLEGIMVITLYTIGKILESKAINNTRNSIKGLIDIKQDYAYKKNQNNKIEQINVNSIKIGDKLIVKKGERVPVDGVIIKGSSEFDTSALTGESEYVKLNPNEPVLSGSINTDKIVEIKATKTYTNSTAYKIIELVENATDKKAHTETTVSKISKIYTPIILSLALIVIIFFPILTNITYKESIYRGLIFLVISCPCAIAISVPLSYFVGIGVSSKNGILIKGSNYLDNLNKINKIIFDKTGTLTTGSFKVKKIEILDNTYNMEEIINILGKGENLSNHPIAKSIMKYINKEIDSTDVEDYKEISGKGISYKYKENEIIIGTKSICHCNEDAIIHLNINKKHIASITIDDGIKKNTPQVINTLKNMNIKTYMFTGDKKETALEIGQKLGIDQTKYEMLPDTKYKEYQKIKQNNEIVAFVGDGINDAPTLKLADIGISMGGIGTQAAVESSDIVIMNDDLSKIILGINISKYTNTIIIENLTFAILVKIIVLSFSIFGLATMWIAVFADTGVTLLTILNTLRIFKKYKVKQVK